MNVSADRREPGAVWPGTRTWFAVALAVLGLVLAASVIVGAHAVAETVRSSDRLAQEVQPAAVSAQRLRAALAGQETGVQGYVLGGQDALLEPYRAGLAEQRTAAAHMRGLLRGDGLLDGLDRVESLAADWRRGHAEPFIARVRAGEEIGADDVRASMAAFARVRAALDEQDRELGRAQEAAVAGLRQARAWRDGVLAVIVGTFVATAVVIALLLRYVVLRPLRRLGASARRVASGDFDHVIHIDGPEDLVRLGDDVESMRRRIVDELAAIRDAERRMRAQADQLERQALTLRRSNAELEQFAYVASHDLQEPLRKVAAFCQMLQRRYAGQLDDRANEYIGFAVDGAKRMQTLINELLTYSRVGRLHDERVPVDLGDAFDRALASLGRRLDAPRDVVDRPRLPRVVGDPLLLGMVWQHLLDNAVKFRHPDRPPRVRVEARRVGDLWEFAVADNGIGIEPRFADKIFIIFQRLHGRDAYDGTGLGLALCKKIVEHHGGTIALDTGYAGGSRFVFTLPAAAAPEPAEPAPAPAAAPEPSGAGLAAMRVTSPST